MTKLPGGTVGLLTVNHAAAKQLEAAGAHVDPAAGLLAAPRRRAIFNVIFDNSASMGGSTKNGLEAIIKPLLSTGWFTATLVTLFDETTTSFTLTSLVDYNQMMAKLPSQQCTNITLGVEDSMKYLAKALRSIPDQEEVHVLSMLLTDGGHNRGPAITPVAARAMRDCVSRARSHGASEDARLFHTVLAFCLTDSADAGASMIAKEVIETAAISELPSVFYAKSHADMVAALNQVVVACEGIFAPAADDGTVFARLQLLAEGCEFVATGSDVATYRFPPQHTETFVVTLAKEGSVEKSSWVQINKERVPVFGIPIGPDGTNAAMAAVAAALQPLTRQAVAFSLAVIEKRLSALEGLVVAIDQIAEAEKAAARSQRGTDEVEGGRVARTPAERRVMLKKVISTQYGLHEIRNALAALRVKGRSNSDSISLLTGNQRAYAHVASKRSGTESRTAAEVAANTAATGTTLKALLEKDVAAALEAGIDIHAVMPTTSVTLQSNFECLMQWAEEDAVASLTPGQANDDGLMELLAMFGLAAYPVKLVTSDCTQVDLTQMAMTDICLQVADSASLMMSWRLNQPIRYADGNTYTELMLLVDPALPHATTHVLCKSLLVQHLLSAVISKDLYMYVPAMHATMHTHGFATAVRKSISLAAQGAAGGTPPIGSWIRMALQIVYSARKLANTRMIFCENESFSRWLLELQSVTRSDADQVYNVATLFLKLAFTKVNIAEVDERAALLNALTEHLARRLAQPIDKCAAPAAFAHDLFAMRAADAPQPIADPLTPEPEESLIRASCRKYLAPAAVTGVAGPSLAALVLPNGAPAASVREYVEAHWLDLFNLHQFAMALHDALGKAGSTPDDLCGLFEREGGVPEWVVLSVQRHLAATGTDAAAMWATLSVSEKNVDAVCAAAIMQACVFNKTSERSGVVNAKDITDGDEQRALIEELYMVHYHVACGSKSKSRIAIIGSVSAMRATTGDLSDVADMIGVHTHGHCKQAFWGMLRGILADPVEQRRLSKLQLFRSKSNAAFGKRCV